MLAVSTEKQSSESAAHLRRPVRPRILISDDQHDILTALSLLLKLNHYTTVTVNSPREVMEAACKSTFDLLLIDMNYSRDTTSGQEGLQLLSQLRQTGVVAPIVVMTAWGNVELAVEAMRLGASDFVQKPWDNQHLLSTISKQLQRAELEHSQRLQLRSELEIARHVQQKLLPQNLQFLEHLELAATCAPAREVGGDYYDFFTFDKNRMAGLLADVSGKGVAAAMLMANLQACFRSQIDAGNQQPTSLLQTVNRLFHLSTPAEQYVTLFYFDYDDVSRRFRYVNCGHLPPAVLHANGTIERLHATGTVLGLFPQCPCDCGEIILQDQDLVALFTDGVTEFQDDEGNEFGDDRFLALVQTSRKLNLPAMLQHLFDRLDTARRGAEQFDDQTVVLLRAR